MSKELEQCKGCYTNNNLKDRLNCSMIYRVREGSICPCSICLVKSVCNHECEDFAHFRRNRGR